MILPDANILLYAVDESSPLHADACAWIEGVLSGPDTVALDWMVLLAFIRISTRANVFSRPLTIDQALDMVDAWLAQPNVTVVYPADRHAAVIRDLLKPVGGAGNLVSDAHLAATAIELGATLYSYDNDFTRFQGLRWSDPREK